MRVERKREREAETGSWRDRDNRGTQREYEF